jgi:hypothetical protein
MKVFVFVCVYKHQSQTSKVPGSQQVLNKCFLCHICTYVFSAGDRTQGLTPLASSRCFLNIEQLFALLRLLKQ